ncbi:PaaI family thioesterase [Pseudarthrobacter sp. NIBRBAC000502772]|uniref:PaaI family thioesterase n=1 Tax=Pseudarthrobacter sp. NIBRBAC000502772 TaxID=2590775 RepID=UPI00143D3F8A|nr:PaaI family thioesterase [Pseudarthrobacter sp. NIBRBAC000502772]
MDKATACYIDHEGSVERRFGIDPCQWTGERRLGAMRLPAWTTSTSGQGHGGVIAVLLDHVLGEEVFATGSAGQWSVTTELSVAYLAPVPAIGTLLLAHASLVTTDGRGGFARGEVLTEAGQVIATGAVWANHVPLSPEIEHRIGSARARGLVMPDDIAPPAAAVILGQLGAVASSTAVRAVLEVAHPDRWANLFGTLHGGVWACLAHLVVGELLSARTTTPSTIASLSVHFLRPAPPASLVTLTAEYEHQGRSFAVVTVRGTNDAGTTCITATANIRR